MSTIKHPQGKVVVSNVKLCLESGKATPAPPVGSVLGQYSVNIMDFCKEFNAKSSQLFAPGSIVNVKLSVYKDKKYKIHSIELDTIYLLKKAAGMTKCSATPGRKIYGSITKQMLQDIAQTQMHHLNAYNIENAMKIISGTARSAGIEVKEA